MKKIKEMYDVHSYRVYYYRKTNLPFFNWLYIQCNSKDIDNFWLSNWPFCCFYQSLSPINGDDKEILYL
jgi:hypothetical protein